MKKTAFRKVSTAAKSGSQLDTLLMLRDTVSRYIDDPEIQNRDRVSFIIQLRQIMIEINEVLNEQNNTQEEEQVLSPIDEIAKRRKSRVS